MIEIENVQVSGWEAAIRGMRNPMNSWDRMDSHPCPGSDYYIGQNDMELMKRLTKAGPVHAKYLRMITVTADILAPLYWWKEFDTYKVGTVANSCSTMHKIQAKEFELDDFSHEHLGESTVMNGIQLNVALDSLKQTISTLNTFRTWYLETKDKKQWWGMIQLLPSSYNQRRTVMLSYETLCNIYPYRKNHKLDEWREFCKWIETLPYAKELIVERYSDEARNA